MKKNDLIALLILVVLAVLVIFNGLHVKNNTTLPSNVRETQPSSAQTNEENVINTNSVRNYTEYTDVTSDLKIIKALELLKNTRVDNGYVYNSIMGSNIYNKPIKIKFKDLAVFANGKYEQFDALGWSKNEQLYIFINNKHKNSPPCAIAALISGRSVNQDIEDSKAEELYSLLLETKIWTELTNDNKINTNPNDSLIQREKKLHQLYKEDQLKNFVIKNYSSLPDTSPGFQKF